MRRLPHGYTNETFSDGISVVKKYSGADADARATREYAALIALRGRVAVPRVLDRTATTITVAFVPGAHGQDLIALGHADAVLRTCGLVLHDIHTAGFGHGDYGPNNLLLDPVTFAATAVLDWEFAVSPLVDPVADLAWCEWIVRTHHADHRSALVAFFTAYGHTPTWQRRHASMLARCSELLDVAHSRDPEGSAEQLWRHRLTTTATWREDG